ncbi:hypothetical protein SELMODRAFT_417874 [Selaginella moellendorffii]|uniref:Uncharacterized protein n=1 Tax=Selaginella moellendorffii TaxID=88036 RepID=D8S3X8_SELML|nr:hypothetical protein SELMODRAFT_417874 [Selaginella moellendorffii]
MEVVQAKLVAYKGQELLTWYQVPIDFLVTVWAKVEQNSYLKITQVTNEVQKNLELQQIEKCILNSKKSKEMRHFWREWRLPQDRDKIHIEQTEGEKMLEKPISTLYTDIQMHSFHPSPLLQRMTSKSYLHQLHINSFENYSSSPSFSYGKCWQCGNSYWGLFSAFQQHEASKVLQYEGIMLVILPRSLFWGGLLAMIAENDDSRLVEFASGCLLSNILVETKGAGFSMELPCSLPLLLPSQYYMN